MKCCFSWFMEIFDKRRPRPFGLGSAVEERVTEIPAAWSWDTTACT